jgi:transcriptional regulator with XRE-family HTH domain
MSRLKRPELQAEAGRRNREQLGRAGGEIRQSRKLLRLTQADLAERIGVVQSTVSLAERGLGGSLSFDLWQRLALAVDRPLIVDFARDRREETADAGHLKIQELVLRQGRVAGYQGTFELPTRPTDPSRSADVGLRDDLHRRLVLLECWNVIGDIGAAARSTARKVSEADALAVAIWGDSPYQVSSCWVVRATRRNRELVARYPEVFSARFPGSSAGWVRALVAGTEPPSEPGMVWCDVDATRLVPWRRRFSTAE